MGNKIELKKDDVKKGIIALVVVVVGYFFLFGGSGSATGELSGSVIEAEREMGDFACHFMGGGYMGDCVTREVSYTAGDIVINSGEVLRLNVNSDKNYVLSITGTPLRMNIRNGVTTDEIQVNNAGEYPIISSADGEIGKLIVLG